jgi:hypothetical protein
MKQAGSAVSPDAVGPPSRRRRPDCAARGPVAEGRAADTLTVELKSASVSPAETEAPPESTTTPGTSSVGQAPGTARSVRTAETDQEIDDHFRHIICVLCYPEFEGTRQAPHDAVCICGKRLAKGASPAPVAAPQCILCNEMYDHHFAVAHGKDK